MDPILGGTGEAIPTLVGWLGGGLIAGAIACALGLLRWRR